jgi:hypothetical protein
MQLYEALSELLPGLGQVYSAHLDVLRTRIAKTKANTANAIVHKEP